MKASTSTIVTLLCLILICFCYSNEDERHGKSFKVNKDASTYKLGRFLLSVCQHDKNPYLEVYKDDISFISKNEYILDNNIIWKSVKDKPFVRLGQGNVTHPPIVNGNYQLEELTSFITDSVSIDSIDVFPSYISIFGRLFNEISNIQYKYCFIFSLSDNDGKDSSSLQFNIKIIEYPDKSILNTITSSLSPRIFFYASSTVDESFHGFGESFTYFSYKGLRVPILVSEQGIGRGEEPITSYFNKFSAEGVGGHWYTTYAPKALYLTNHNHSIFIDESVVMFIDLTKPYEVEFEVWSDHMAGYIFSGSSWIELIKAITSVIGRQSGELPLWSQTGAIVGLEGGTVNVSQEVKKMMDFGVPITGVSCALPVVDGPLELRGFNMFQVSGYKTGSD